VNRPRPNGASVTVEITPEAPSCPACSRPGILSATVPHSVVNARGEQITDQALAVLCETCDIDDPEAGPLIAYFAVHGQISAETFDQGSALVSAWLFTAQPKTFPDEAAGRENQAGGPSDG